MIVCSLSLSTLCGSHCRDAGCRDPVAWHVGRNWIYCETGNCHRNSLVSSQSSLGLYKKSFKLTFYMKFLHSNYIVNWSEDCKLDLDMSLFIFLVSVKVKAAWFYRVSHNSMSHYSGLNQSTNQIKAISQINQSVVIQIKLPVVWHGIMRYSVNNLPNIELHLVQILTFCT